MAKFGGGAVRRSCVYLEAGNCCRCGRQIWCTYLVCVLYILWNENLLNGANAESYRTWRKCRTTLARQSLHKIKRHGRHTRLRDCLVTRDTRYCATVSWHTLQCDCLVTRDTRDCATVLWLVTRDTCDCLVTVLWLMTHATARLSRDSCESFKAALLDFHFVDFLDPINLEQKNSMRFNFY